MLSLQVIFIAGSLVGISLLLLSFKLGLKRILGYQLYADLILSVILMIVFAGTQGGMMIGIIGGLFISVVLWGLKALIGYERLGWSIVKIKIPGLPLVCPTPQIVWKSYPGILNRPPGYNQRYAGPMAGSQTMMYGEH